MQLLPRPEPYPEVVGTYEYDFGESWQHEILLGKIMEPGPNVAYPRCVEG